MSQLQEAALHLEDARDRLAGLRVLADNASPGALQWMEGVHLSKLLAPIADDLNKADECLSGAFSRGATAAKRRSASYT